MLWWCTILAAWAGKWDDAETDVVVYQTLRGTPETIHAVVADLRTYRRLFSDECARNWLVREPTTGIDASVDVRYTFGPLRRSLTAVITRDDPGTLWQLEHKGNRGWYTQVKYRPGPTDDETQVTLFTPLSAPPWPLKGVFYNRVRPAMVICYEQALDALNREVEAQLPPE